MNQGHLSVEQAADEDFTRIRDFSENGVDVVAPRMGPPTAADRFADNRFGEPGSHPSRRGEDNAVLANEGQRFFGGRAADHDARREGMRRSTT